MLQIFVNVILDAAYFFIKNLSIQKKGARCIGAPFFSLLHPPNDAYLNIAGVPGGGILFLMKLLK